jgi:GDP-mannose 6-dehydrogenase
MRISVYGLGYVGSVTAACLARNGHTVIGVDPDANKTEPLSRGIPPVLEEGLAEITTTAVEQGRLSVTQDASEGIARSDLSIVCVGTPSRRDGSLETKYLERVAAQIGAAIGEKDSFHIVVIRSTSLPGTTESLITPILEEHSGKRAGRDFGVAFNPEFLREGTAVADFDRPPKTVVGASDERTLETFRSLFAHLDAPFVATTVAAAEMVKYADNAWHAVKISFANEIGNIAQAAGLDGRDVMGIFCQDQKLNLSEKYLKPGQGFGGSCLPKDLRALTHYARMRSLDIPLVNSVLASNRVQVDKAIELVIAQDAHRVGVLGFSFKAGTDDLRESPVVELVERLVGKGYDLRIFDESVEIARLIGANQNFIAERVPHLNDILAPTVDAVLEHAEVIVIGTDGHAFRDVLARATPDHLVIDLIGLEGAEQTEANYFGICW